MLYFAVGRCDMVMMSKGQTLQSCWNRYEKLQIRCIVSVADGSSEEKAESNMVTVNVISSEFLLEWDLHDVPSVACVCVCARVCVCRYACAC